MGMVGFTLPAVSPVTLPARREGPTMSVGTAGGRPASEAQAVGDRQDRRVWKIGPGVVPTPTTRSDSEDPAAIPLGGVRTEHARAGCAPGTDRRLPFSQQGSVRSCVLQVVTKDVHRLVSRPMEQRYQCGFR